MKLIQVVRDTTTNTEDSKYTVAVESFDNISSYWLNSEFSLNWQSVFVLPSWLKVWWNEFGSASDLHLCAVRKKETLIGIAPLKVNGQKASFIGEADVCDYLDFIVAPGRGREFFNVLLGHLNQQGIKYLDLSPLRPDSTVLADLVEVAKDQRWEVSCSSEIVAFALDLPTTWDEYLQMLSGKQRHEIKRKFRRLYEAASIDFRVVEDIKEINKEMDTFFALFGSNRSDKATFMTDRMASFFKSLAQSLAQAKILKLYILYLDTVPAAAVMGFDYRSTIYLYNNGYDHRFSSLSVGLLSKVLSIKDSIQKGRERYDFLKGAEAYKHRLGGKEFPLSRCQIRLG